MSDSRLSQLLEILSRHDLNQHPFYQDWRAGTLPAEKLRDYAKEYGTFVATIGQGWATVGQDCYVQEEAQHVALWADFASELGTAAGGINPHTVALKTVADQMFSSKSEAVGALFAFEAQQPETAKSKLAGLEEHYQFSEPAKEYFRVHARQHTEYDELVEMIGAMSDEEFARAKSACSLLAAAMWSGLDGVYYAA